jgi:hypothetical protein
MIPKSGNRFSERIMRKLEVHDPEKWESVLGKDHAQARRLLERDADSQKSHPV